MFKYISQFSISFKILLSTDFVEKFPNFVLVPGFCHCDWGVAYYKDCPAGLHFNPVLQVCDWPQDAGCKVASRHLFEHIHTRHWLQLLFELKADRKKEIVHSWHCHVKVIKKIWRELAYLFSKNFRWNEVAVISLRDAYLSSSTAIACTRSYSGQ